MDGPLEKFESESPWEKWFAWYPVKVNGTRVWGKSIYRRQLEWFEWFELGWEEHGNWEYKTLFDLLKEPRIKNSSPPSNPIIGMVWCDVKNNNFFIYDGFGWDLLPYSSFSRRKVK